MRKRLFVLVCLVALILLSLVTRTYDLDGKSIWSDESLSLYRAQKSVPFILSGRIVIQGVPTQDTQPPLYFLLLHTLMAVAGTGTFVARYLSVLASLLIIPLLYVLGRRLLGDTAGLLTALMGALSPLYLWYAQEIRMYTLLVALSVASVYALIRAVGNGKPEVRWALAYFAITAAMVYTHYSAFFLLGFQGLYLVIQASRRRRWWLIVPMAVAGLITVPVLPFVVRRLGLGPERDFHFVPLWVIVRDLWNAFSLGLSVDFYRVYPLDVAFLAVLIVGLLALLRRRRGTALFLTAYLFLPVLALYGASHIKPMYQGARHLMIVSPAYYLLLGAGMQTLRRRARPALLASLAVIALGTSLSTSNYFTDPRYLKDDLRGLAEYFQAHRGPNDALIVGDGVLTLAFEYYLGADAPIDAIPRFGTHLQPDFPEQIQALVDRYDRLWFMSPHPPVREWLDQHLFQSDEVFFEGMNIPVMAAVYEGEAPYLVEVPSDLRGKQVELGSRLAFQGYTVPHNPVRAGEVFATYFYWELQTPLEVDYRIATTLVDDAGHVWGRGDTTPFGGLHPTSTWEPHTVLRQRHELAVNPGAPPGIYRLKLQVYDPTSGTPLSTGRGSLVDLGDIEVVRPETCVAPNAVPLEVTRDVNFGSALRLLGFDLATRVRRPGDEVPLATYWLALEDLNRDYQLWLRLVGADGRVLTERTVAPASGSYPTSRWRAGDVIQDQHRLIVPADAQPGDAAIVLSVVDPAGRPLTAHRLRWLPVGGTDIRLGTVEIAPRDDVVTAAPTMQHSLDVELGSAISLLGYDLKSGLSRTADRKAQSVKPGQQLSVVLYWRTNAVLDGNLKVTVQVLSSDNQIVVQHDSVPADWDRPTAGWLPGEVILDSHALTVGPETPPGEYRLIAAMYDPTSNSRLPVIQDGESRDHVVLETLAVH